jgi:hypothetical protein
MDIPNRVDFDAMNLFAIAEMPATFNQAVGMVSVQCSCSLDDAADLIAARAFASGASIAQVSAQIVSGDIALADP